MSTTLFTSLMDKVAPSVPGCPQRTALQSISRAARVVCEETLAWRYAQAPFALLPGVAEYEYARPADTDVHAVFEALLDSSPLCRVTLEVALAQYPAWVDLFSGVDPAVVWAALGSGVMDLATYNTYVYGGGSLSAMPAAALADAGTPVTFTQLTPDKYVLLPLPDDSGAVLRLVYALKPTRAAAGMDTSVLSEIEDAVVHGALQYLLVLPNVPWSDRELAAYHAKQFRAAVTRRRARANLGNMRATMVAYGGGFQ